MTDETILALPWKGKSELTIEDDTPGDNYFLCEWRKDKETRTPIKLVHVVPKERVRVLHGLITKTCAPNEKYGYRYVIRKLIQFYDIAEKEGVSEEVMLDMFNGGKMRAKHYFPKYHWPVKILESLGVVQYYGHGGLAYLREPTKPI
jgi:hypothetical protein